MIMTFEWDDFKNEQNFLKHGFDFTDAKHVFEDKVVSFPDQRFMYGEERFITLGMLFGRVLVVVHTFRAGRIRVISMRKANARERKIYQERLKSG